MGKPADLAGIGERCRAGNGVILTDGLKQAFKPVGGNRYVCIQYNKMIFGVPVGTIHRFDKSLVGLVSKQQHIIGPIAHWSLFGGQGGALSEIGLGVAWCWYIIPQCYIEFAPRYLGSLWDSDFSELKYDGVVGVRL